MGLLFFVHGVAFNKAEDREVTGCNFLLGTSLESSACRAETTRLNKFDLRSK